MKGLRTVDLEKKLLKAITDEDDNEATRLEARIEFKEHKS